MTDVMEAPVGVEPTPAGARAPIEFRRASEMEVRFPDRVIELVAVPYDEETVVEYPVGSGRLVKESIAPGAFDGIERRANRIKVNRDHDRTRPVGRAVRLHPSRSEGLVAELRISRGAVGDETLELAADGVLDASVGFGVLPEDQTWTENRARRIVNKAWLGHIALVSEPAYDGAQVLSVRHEASGLAVAERSTPNLDEVRGWTLGERYRSIA